MRRKNLAHSLALRAALATPLLFPGCVCNGARHGLPPQAEQDFGDIAARATDPEPQLALARAALETQTQTQAKGTLAQGATPGITPRGPRKRVMLADFRPGREPLVATAIGPTEGDAVAMAAAAIASRAANAPGPPDVGDRLELDVPTDLEGADFGEDMGEPLASLGLKGVLVTRDDGRTGAILPS
jgi:hypothetical protein